MDQTPKPQDVQSMNPQAMSEEQKREQLRQESEKARRQEYEEEMQAQTRDLEKRDAPEEHQEPKKELTEVEQLQEEIEHFYVAMKKHGSGANASREMQRALEHMEDAQYCLQAHMMRLNEKNAQ